MKTNKNNEMKEYKAVYGPTNVEYDFKAKSTRWAKVFVYNYINCKDIKIYEIVNDKVGDLVATIDGTAKAIKTAADIAAIDPCWSLEDYKKELATHPEDAEW